MERMLEATASAEDRHFWFIGLRRTAKQVLDRALAGRPATRLLDCGAGTGRNLEWLAHYGTAVGVELAPAGLAHARRRGRPVARGTVTALPLADDSVDAVTSFDVLYCLSDEDEGRAVREMFRVLRPGGVLLVNVAALDLLRGAHSALTHEIRRYTPARLRDLLERAGFTVERLTFTNMVTFPLTLAVRTFDRWSGRAGVASEADLTVPPPPINAALDAALKLESALLKVVNLPIGASLLCLARKPGPRLEGTADHG